MLVDQRTGRGFIVRGTVWQIIAEGGAGKTMSLLQLAVAIACGCLWLGTFLPSKRGRVLVLVAEEDHEECVRRLQHVCLALGVIPDEGDIVVCGLHGHSVNLLRKDRDGNYEDTAFAKEVKMMVASESFELVIVDPLSRFASEETETSNFAGTQFVQALERIGKAGNTTLVNAHHVNKTSTGNGKKLDANSGRGSSSIKDAVRAVFSLSVEKHEDENGKTEKHVWLHSVKQNYSADPDAVPLRVRDEFEGVLMPLSEEERKAYREKKEREEENALEAESQSLLAHIHELMRNGNLEALDSATKLQVEVHVNKNRLLEILNHLESTGRIEPRTKNRTRIRPFVENGSVYS